MPSVSTTFCTALYKAGLRTIFSVPGAQLLSLWDDAEKCGLEILVPRSEEGGVWLAAGYSLAANRPALLANTLGPGIINELPALMGMSCYPVRMLFVHVSQPPEKLSHIDMVFQGIHTAPATERWFDVTLEIQTESDIEPVLKKIARLFSSVKKKDSLCVRLDMEFPLLFEKQQRSETSGGGLKGKLLSFLSGPLKGFTEGFPSEPDSKRSSQILIGSASWTEKIKKNKAFQENAPQILNPHPKIRNRSHTFLLAIGFLLGGGEAAFLKTTPSQFVYDCEHFLLAKDWDLPLRFCISKKSYPILDRERLHLEIYFPEAELYYGKTINSKLNAEAKGLWVEF